MLVQSRAAERDGAVTDMATAASEVSSPAARASDPGTVLAGLFDGHARTVYALCAVLLRDAHEAEDATQQAFLSAFEAIGAGTLPERPEAWLYSIARNECLDRLRRRARRPESPLEREPVAPGADVVAERNAALAALCAALRDLPARQRDALVLHEVCGLGYAQVAAALGVSTAAVESLIFRARRQLGERSGTVRALAAALVLPVGLRESVAGAAPGFGAGGVAGVGASGGSALSAGGVAASLTAKVLALPIAGKLAVAAAVVAGAGSVGYGVEQAAGGPAAPREASAPLVVAPASVAAPAIVLPGSNPTEDASASASDEAHAEPPPAAAQQPAEEPTSGAPAASRPPGHASGLPAPAPPAKEAAAPPPDELQHTEDASEPPAAVEEPPASESEPPDEPPDELPSDQPGDPPPSGGDGDGDSAGGADPVDPPAGGGGDPVDESDGGEGEDADEAGDGESGGNGDGAGDGGNGDGSPGGGADDEGQEAGDPAPGPPEARCRAWRRMDAVLHALLDADRLERWHTLGARLGCSH